MRELACGRNGIAFQNNGEYFWLWIVMHVVEAAQSDEDAFVKVVATRLMPADD